MNDRSQLLLLKLLARFPFCVLLFFCTRYTQQHLFVDFLRLGLMGKISLLRIFCQPNLHVFISLLFETKMVNAKAFCPFLTKFWTFLADLSSDIFSNTQYYPCVDLTLTNFECLRWFYFTATLKAHGSVALTLRFDICW